MIYIYIYYTFRFQPWLLKGAKWMSQPPDRTWQESGESTAGQLEAELMERNGTKPSKKPPNESKLDLP